MHVPDISRVEVGEIEVGQAAAVIKHPRHIRDIGRIEIGEAECNQAVATIKHPRHIPDIGSIKVIPKINTGEFCFSKHSATV